MSREGKQLIKHLVVIGVGLIGGSVARALRHAGCVERITGVGRGRENLERARELGVIDHWTHDVAEAVRDADMVLVAVPMGAFEQTFADMAAALPAGAVVTDAGSTKQLAVEVARRHLKDLSCFVPAHPIAGTEQSGVEASFAELFEDRLCILTPLAESSSDALNRVRELWKATKSRVVEMDAVSHDDFLAAVSHLPHLAAFALVNAVRKMGDEDHDPFQFAAGGFRDFTRIASSSPVMWRDISLSNRQSLIHKIDAYTAELNALRDALEQENGEALLEVFAAAKQARDNWLAEHGGSL